MFYTKCINHTDQILADFEGIWLTDFVWTVLRAERELEAQTSCVFSFSKTFSILIFPVLQTVGGNG